ncbi:hypothetical protein OED52_17915 [Rhodococcus sp. Z13]|uniref:Uncharacterized protein n=1 Tax=Rhodococcus sacchari TaxID=2962047 RepID=A0ACD4DFP8_9NOCA|nr:hypothetical protein [Rhodococcus sp. Z13]UYP18508.1 hypothetical protein OED52_17915 [Rhodococcus sp. Z13]
MESVGKKAALVASGAALLALAVPGTSAAAGPSVSAEARDGGIVVDFDLLQADVNLGVTCVTYVLKQGVADTAEPSGRIDGQPAGSTFSVRNTSTSKAVYVVNGGPAAVGPEAITAGTYKVFWGCQDAAGTRYENIFDANGRPFTGGITVTVGDAAPQAAQPAPQRAEVPQAQPAPEPANPLAFLRQFLRDLTGIRF